MQAVILAAGKGERMGELSLETPKPLLIYKNKNLLEWKLDELPSIVDEVIIVIGHLGEKIQSIFGNMYNGKKITYVLDKEIKGTAKALWQAKEFLGDRFLVMMGDDLYNKGAFSLACDNPWSVTIKKVDRGDNSSRVEFDNNGNLINFLTAEKYRAKYSNRGFAFTGLYSLTKDIFKYPLIKMKTKDEWGLPQTLLQAIPDINLKIIETDFWKQITVPKDLD